MRMSPRITHKVTGWPASKPSMNNLKATFRWVTITWLTELLLIQASFQQASSSDDKLGLDASDFETTLQPAQDYFILNQTCFKLCQLGNLQPISEGFRAAMDVSSAAALSNTGSTKGTAATSQSLEQQDTPRVTSSDAEAAVGTTASPPRSKSSTSTSTAARAKTSRHLLIDASGTTSSTSQGSVPNAALGSVASSNWPTAGDGSTVPAVSCAEAIDPQAAALLARRYRGFKVSLGMSDFFELFYSMGNLWTAINDLLKQGLTAMATGHFQVDAEQVLLFNSNMASITAWWANLVQNILLLTGDQLLPLPIDTPSD